MRHLHLRQFLVRHQDRRNERVKHWNWIVKETVEMKFDIRTFNIAFMAVFAAGLIFTGCTTAGDVSCLYRNVETQGPFRNSPEDSISIQKSFDKNERKLESQCDQFILGDGNKLYLLIQTVSSTPLYPVVDSKSWSNDELYDL